MARLRSYNHHLEWIMGRWDLCRIFIRGKCFGIEEMKVGGGDLHDSNCIIVKDSRDVFGREFVCCVADEETSLAHRTVTDDHASITAPR
jgi:hypothetical protein